VCRDRPLHLEVAGGSYHNQDPRVFSEAGPSARQGKGRFARTGRGDGQVVGGVGRGELVERSTLPRAESHGRHGPVECGAIPPSRQPAIPQNGDLLRIARDGRDIGEILAEGLGYRRGSGQL